MLYGLRTRLEDLEWHLICLGVVDASASRMDRPPLPPKTRINRSGASSESHHRTVGKGNRGSHDDDDDSGDEGSGAGDLDGNDYEDGDAEDLAQLSLGVD